MSWYNSSHHLFLGSIGGRWGLYRMTSEATGKPTWYAWCFATPKFSLYFWLNRKSCETDPKRKWLFRRK